MAYENSGRLFKNDKKKSDKSPDYTGDFTDADGKKMNVAAWVKAGTQGRDNWLSFRISEQRAPEENLAQPDGEGGRF